MSDPCIDSIPPLRKTATDVPPAQVQAMIDIETFDTDSSRSVIISVACVKFQMYGPAPVILPEALVMQLDIRQQVMDGRQINPETIAFWQKQSKNIRDQAVTGVATDEGVVLAMIEHFIGDPLMPVWANGSVFDIANIESLARERGRKPAWRYDSPRDARTIYKVNPRRRNMPVEFEQEFKEGLHDPLVDCNRQVWKLWEHWPFS